MALPQEAAQEPPGIVSDLVTRFGESTRLQTTVDDYPTVWVERENIQDVLRFLKHDADTPYELLYDLSAIDERLRKNREGQPTADFTVFYHLISLVGDHDLRVKVPLRDDDLHVKRMTCLELGSTITPICAAF